jgi:flagellar biosynthesis/type III secretory pathway protein FliH
VKTASKRNSINISGWNDISVAIQEFIQKQVEAAVNEKLEAAKKAEYQKGFEDGKLSNTHDVEDSYRKGFEEGKKQAKKDLLTLIKEVG